MKKSSWHIKHPGAHHTDFMVLIKYMADNNITSTNDGVVQDILDAKLFNGRHNSIPAVDKMLSKIENVAVLSVYNKDKSEKWWQTYQTMHRTMVQYNFKLSQVNIDTMNPDDIFTLIGKSRGANKPAKTQRLCTTKHTFEYMDTWQHHHRVLKQYSISDIIACIDLYGREVGQTFTDNFSTIARYMNGGSGYENGPPLWFKRFASWATTNADAHSDGIA